MKLIFTKYQGSGNDFVICDGMQYPDYQGITSDTIKQICDRKFGVGADGFIILVKDESEDFKMIYHNADGNLSSMCGNGGRCIADFAHSRGYSSDNCSFMAVDGRHEASILEPRNRVRLQMSDVTAITRYGRDFVLNTGSPHYVRITAKDEKLDIVQFGREIRYSPDFADEGINVNTCFPHGDHIHVATYERGVEDRTLSCGTGVTAGALVAAQYAPEYQGKEEIEVKTKGGNLKVGFRKNVKGFTDVWLEGPVSVVFEGQMTL